MHLEIQAIIIMPLLVAPFIFSAFFKNAGGNDLGGGGGDIVIAAPKRNPNVNYADQA